MAPPSLSISSYPISVTQTEIKECLYWPEKKTSLWSYPSLSSFEKWKFVQQVQHIHIYIYIFHIAEQCIKHPSDQPAIESEWKVKIDSTVPNEGSHAPCAPRKTKNIHYTSVWYGWKNPRPEKMSTNFTRWSWKRAIIFLLHLTHSFAVPTHLYLLNWYRAFTLSLLLASG